MRKALGVLTAIVAAAGAAVAQPADPIIGPATVVDSDGIRIGDASIMLWGIESVERPQTCAINGLVWDCYTAAIRALQTITDLGAATCERVGRPDGYGRILAVCSVNGVDINEALVRAGFALAKRNETEDYVPAEEAARAEKIGLWQGDFVLPADYRVSHGVFTDRP